MPQTVAFPCLQIVVAVTTSCAPFLYTLSHANAPTAQFSPLRRAYTDSSFVARSSTEGAGNELNFAAYRHIAVRSNETFAAARPSARDGAAARLRAAGE